MQLGERIKTTENADIHLFDQTKVIKLFNKGISEEIVDYEYKISLTAKQYGCTCPDIYERTEVEGRHGLVFERIIGKTINFLLKKPFSSAKQMAMHTASAHAQINKVAFGSSGHPFDENSIVLKRQYDYFRSKILKIEVLSDEEKKSILDYLHRLPDALRLCHGNLHTSNFIVSKSKHYIVNWENAYIGHPASDVARTVLMLQIPYDHEDIPGLLKPMFSMILQSYAASYIKMYTSITEIEKRDIDAWMLPVAAARLSENRPHEREWLIAFIKDELHKQSYH